MADLAFAVCLSSIALGLIYLATVYLRLEYRNSDIRQEVREHADAAIRHCNRHIAELSERLDVAEMERRALEDRVGRVELSRGSRR